ncbi:hypothetical protein [Paenibacillus flagellatus]|uniref:hypothetical protein n=1 Tax=Paenibacillus flagellatus TaxID=2211139 RepID=UPI001FEA709D|nr:hypothetical protein [Paenibacillus flagellatus]
MSANEYLLYCDPCNEYTALGKYIDKEGRFEGEYSLLYNRHIHSDDMLCRFLIRHADHALRLHPNRTEAYSDILRNGNRFMDQDVDAFLELDLDRKERMKHELDMERGLGQLQLHVLLAMLKEEAESLSKKPTATPAESQFLLGKEEGVKHAISVLEELLDKTSLYYK